MLFKISQSFVNTFWRIFQAYPPYLNTGIRLQPELCRINKKVAQRTCLFTCF